MEVVKQEGIKDCGVCSLLSIIRHYKGDVSLEYLRELTKTTKNGVSAYHLVEAASKLGFHAYGIKIKLEDIEKDALPMISHVIINKSYQHFIVIYEINKQKKELLIMDPAFGKKRVSFQEFHLMTSDNYIYLKPVKKILKLEKKKIINEWIIRFIKDHKKYIPHILILTGIYFITNIISAFYFKLLLNKAINYSMIENVFFISKVMLLVFLLKEVSLYLKNLTLLKWSELLDEELTKNVLKRLMLLPYLYYKNRTTGEVISRMKDLEEIKTFLIKFFSFFIMDSILILLFLFLLFHINKYLGIITIGLSISLLLLEIILNQLEIKKTNRYLQQADQINSLLFENINSMTSIKSLHIEKQKNHSFMKKYQSFLEKAYQLNHTYLFSNLSTNVVNHIFTIFLYTTGSILIIQNKMTLGDLIVFQTILNYYLSSYQNSLSLYKEYHKYRLSKSRIEDLFTIKEENFNCLEYFQEYKLNGTIKITNLTYGYGCQNVFKKLNLKINKKDKIFLTGESGIGKSTLMKILVRLIPIEYGYITINEIDLNHYHLDVIRRKITYVSQQESLFTGTLKENILLEGGKEEELDKVCKLVKVDEFVEKNLGYSKMVEEAGNNFSGGERQRIILARSLLKDSDIYIFDEALNQIDIEKEQEILKNMMTYLKDKIVIVVSHRLTGKNFFNRILTLEGGEIIEEI